MAPPRSKKHAVTLIADDAGTLSQDAPDATGDIIEVIDPESQPRIESNEDDPGRTVTFVLDPTEYHEYHARAQDETDDSQDEGDDSEEEQDSQDEGEEDEDDDDLALAVGQLTQLMMTEEGEAITDVLAGVREAIDKLNKIMYRGLQLLETRLSKK